MNTLTQTERDGLDDVFLSIHANKGTRIQEVSSYLLSKKRDFLQVKFLKQAKYGIKQSNFSQFLSFISKKKKNLSK